MGSPWKVLSDDNRREIMLLFKKMFTAVGVSDKNMRRAPLCVSLL